MTEIVNEAMELLHDRSLPTIELLQRSFPKNQNFMINISTLFDPRYVFLIYAPILFAINRRVGHRMLIALTVTEWANQILKWLLAGERPYWYVHERANELAAANNLTNEQTGINSYDTATLLLHSSSSSSDRQPTMLAHLKQFSITCELGAGSPSGHAMVTATVWYILIDAYLRNELTLMSPLVRANIGARGKQELDDKIAKLSWSFYTLILVLVSMSRVYLACHFPHQCLCGAILGVLVARLITEKVSMEQLKAKHFVATTLFMFLTALSTYAFLRSLGMNPLWSVDKGLRWCDKKENLQLDTTPFFSMMRYLGFCLGAGLAYNATQIASNEEEEEEENISTAKLLIRRTMIASSSILLGKVLVALPMPQQQHQFYLISFLLYTFYSYAMAKPIPKMIKALKMA